MNTQEKINKVMSWIVEKDEDKRTLIAEEIKDILRASQTPQKELATRKSEFIEDILLKLGVPCSLFGYNYLVYAITIASEDEIYIRKITKKLYPAVAEKFETTTSRAERGIRHAIETGWDRCEAEAVARYFKSSVSADRGKPTNSEFISRIAQLVRRECGNG